MEVPSQIDSTATHLAGLGRTATFTTGWGALGVGATAAIGGARGDNFRADRQPGDLTDRAELGPPASGFVGPHNEAADGPAAGGWAA